MKKKILTCWLCQLSAVILLFEQIPTVLLQFFTDEQLLLVGLFDSHQHSEDFRMTQILMAAPNKSDVTSSCNDAIGITGRVHVVIRQMYPCTQSWDKSAITLSQPHPLFLYVVMVPRSCSDTTCNGITCTIEGII
jgi:hypothetical protein